MAHVGEDVGGDAGPQRGRGGAAEKPEVPELARADVRRRDEPVVDVELRQEAAHARRAFAGRETVVGDGEEQRTAAQAGAARHQFAHAVAGAGVGHRHERRSAPRPLHRDPLRQVVAKAQRASRKVAAQRGDRRHHAVPQQRHGQPECAPVVAAVAGVGPQHHEQRQAFHVGRADEQDAAERVPDADERGPGAALAEPVDRRVAVVLRPVLDRGGESAQRRRTRRADAAIVVRQHRDTGAGEIGGEAPVVASGDAGAAIEDDRHVRVAVRVRREERSVQRATVRGGEADRQGFGGHRGACLPRPLTKAEARPFRGSPRSGRP